MRLLHTKYVDLDQNEKKLIMTCNALLM